MKLYEIEQKAAEMGIAISPREKAQIAAAQSAELERLKSISQKELSAAGRWNTAYPMILKMIVSLGETIFTFSQTVIVALGVPLVLVLLLIVEHQRVVHGIALFESDESLASFAAAALVILNLVLEFQVHHIEHQAGYRQELARRWSLRIWWQNTAYRLGIGGTWQAIELSPAARYRSLLRLVTFSILALALVGSMRTVIEAQSGTWYAALWAILTNSSLLSIMTWAGGILFAAAAVLSAQGLSRYVAIRCVEILATMNLNHATDDPYADDLDRAGAIAAQAIIAAKLEKKRMTASMSPFGHTVPDQGASDIMYPTPSANGHTANGHTANGVTK